MNSRNSQAVRALGTLGTLGLLAMVALTGCGASTDEPGGGTPASFTFLGAVYSTSLGTASNGGCTYSGSASGHLVLGPLDTIGGGSDGIEADTMAVSMVLTSHTLGASCNITSYTAVRTNNNIAGPLSKMTASGGDAFTAWSFSGALTGNAMVGSLTLTVSPADPGTGSVVTFQPVTITGYTLTRQ